MIPKIEIPAIEEDAEEYLEALARHNEGITETLTRALTFETAPSREVRLESGLREAIERLRQGDARGALSVMEYTLRHK